MLSRTTRFIDENPMPEILLVAVNLLIGCCALVLIIFKLLSPTGCLGMSVMVYGRMDYINTGMLLLSFSLAISMIFSCLVAIIWKDYRRTALEFHALVLGVGGVHLLAWGVSVLLRGTPEDTFSWFFGLMTMYLTYSVYLLRRTVLSRYIDDVFVVRYLHMIALAVALSLDIGLFLKAYGVFHLAARALAS